MALFKNIGTAVAGLAGLAIGGTIAKVGEAVGSDLVREIGKDVFKATTATGTILGQAADGVVGVVGGAITADTAKVDTGFRDFGGAVNQTLTGVGNGVKKAVQNGGGLVAGLMEGDGAKVGDSARSLVRTAAVAALAVGVLDTVDGGLIDADGAGDGPEPPGDSVDA